MTSPKPTAYWPFSLPSPSTLIKLITGDFSCVEQLKSPGCVDSQLPVYALVPSDLLHRHT